MQGGLRPKKERRGGGRDGGKAVTDPARKIVECRGTLYVWREDGDPWRGVGMELCRKISNAREGWGVGGRGGVAVL